MNHQTISNLDLRIINQTYVPDNVVVNPGTTISWFSNDPGHIHKITIVKKNSNATIYDSGPFTKFQATKPVKLNYTGDFTFYEAGMNREYPAFVLNGTITVAQTATIIIINNFFFL
jgi:plastocyanin